MPYILKMSVVVTSVQSIHSLDNFISKLN